MYSLIVIDDESAIRKGICKYIDWESMGFEVVASFEDGREALTYIKQNKVDVVLTDIEMSEVSGLELANYISRNRLPQKVVIISGYEKFEYARKAVEYGVEHYLLKPIRTDEVVKVFAKLAEDLAHEQQIREQITYQQNRFNELLPEVREQFWSNMLMGGIQSRETILRRLNLLQLDVMLDAPCAVLDISAKCPPDYDKCDHRSLIRNIFAEMDDRMQCFLLFLSDDALKAVSITGEEETLRDFCARLQSLADEKCAVASSLIGIEFCAKIEAEYSSVFELPRYSLVEAKKAHTLESLRPEQSDGLTGPEYENLLQKYKLLMGVITDGDFDGLGEIVSIIFSAFDKLTLPKTKQLVSDMFTMLFNHFPKEHASICLKISDKEVFCRIYRCQNTCELKQCTRIIINDAMEVMHSDQKAGMPDFVERAARFMEEHFGDEISLDIIADKCFLNPAYFSRQFKHHMGITFTDYLIKLRMEKAKELLVQETHRVYEISKLVGYRSEKYFFRIFKQYTGLSPVEYRSKSK